MKHYTDNLSLNHDPFAPAAKLRTFFGGAGRDELLQRLVEQAHYGAPLSAVCGPLGSGKTVLADTFRSSFSEEALCVPIQSTLFMNQAQFLEAVLQQLPIGASSPEPMDIVEDLCHFAERLYLDAKTLVLIVDDAHELSSEVLETIETLITKVPESGVHVLLLGESQLSNLLHTALTDELSEKLLEEQLLPMSSNDAIAYIQQKLDDAGYQGPAPLDNATIGILINESNGMPGAMNARISDALSVSTLTPESPVSPVGAAQQFSWPALGNQYWITAGALCALLLVVLLFPATEEQDQSIPLANEIARDESQRIEIPLDLEETIVQTQQNQEMSDQEIGDQETIDNAIVVEQDSESDIETVQTEPREIASVSKPELNETPFESISEIVESLDLANSDESVASVESVTSEVEVLGSVQDAEATEIIASEFEQQLLSYPAENYTVQIMGSRSEDSVKRFVARELGALNRGYFETRYQEQPWFVVVMGNFVSRDAASRALADLPGDIRELNPWVRSLTDVQSNIRQIRGLN